MILRLVNALQWSLLLLSMLLASLYLSWQGLAQVDYGYSAWYDLLDIEATIESEAPRNRFRTQFELTDRAERERLFSGIVDAINHGGEGLSALVYHTPDGMGLGPLLTRAEVVHLQDVAHLVGRFRTAAWIALGLAVALSLMAVWRRMSPPSAGRLALGSVIGLGGAVLLLAAAGPVRVFYALHEMVFPPDHQWFFYYDESLMSMMMQAPNLFGPIAVLWLVCALALLATVWSALAWVLRRR
ncbi:MAG: DUF1461 domain-containing protein [Gammaproteobacteria bacterium]|nr:DUF1461 domain-containing protein [Gammaproteobacteria bacterium]MCW8972308.1 DUF1461 domain-containing protein [Gammaproteobacteria bacterium]MCW8992722.1 DUF1461 domain-containing protein [Gammaproteobacteria bacterium]